KLNSAVFPGQQGGPLTSGLRIGTAALATGDTEFTEVAEIIAATLAGTADTESLRARVSKLAQSVPLYQGLEDWRLLG
ncbi:serine hydroxymethyltransferase, partial [Nocardia sp. NPDC058497]